MSTPPPQPDLWYDSQHYIEGISLFNRGLYWEAHEAWEEIWLEADGIQSEFLQGLIQSAAALLKYSRNEPAPARRLFDTSSRRLSLCPDFYMGIHVRALQAAMATCFAPLLEGPFRPIDPASIPTLNVE
ncbi:MAG: DUF309 domain-containing protein [Planctomycetota bacterium]